MQLAGKISFRQKKEQNGGFVGLVAVPRKQSLLHDMGRTFRGENSDNSENSFLQITCILPKKGRETTCTVVQVQEERF